MIANISYVESYCRAGDVVKPDRVRIVVAPYVDDKDTYFETQETTMYFTYVAFALIFKLRLDEGLILSSTEMSDTGLGTVAVLARATKKRVSALEHSMSQSFLTLNITHDLQSVVLQIPIEKVGIG